MNDEPNDTPAFRVTDRRGQPKEEPKSAPELKAEPPRAEPKNQPPPKQGEKSQGALPPITFANFIMSLSTSSLMHMGYIEDPNSGKASKNLNMARQEIDLIEMLQAKTHGNLSEDEGQMMEEILYELRLRFVEASKS